MHVLTAVPVYNESRHLPAVLESIRRHSRGDLLVVDDGSTDETPALLAERGDVLVLTHPENRGYGQSLIDAFGFAVRCGYDWVVTLDCDGQHDAAAIPKFVSEAARDDADVISGSRYLVRLNDNDAPPPDRRKINAHLTGLLNSLLGYALTDAFCGFKAYRVAALRRMKLTVPGYAFPIQFWVQAARAGLRVREIPVRLIYNDPNRYFGSGLDVPEARLRHYHDVLIRELVDGARLSPPPRKLSGCRE
jgi:dolichol-phosphate mannosyltransferase